MVSLSYVGGQSYADGIFQSNGPATRARGFATSSANIAFQIGHPGLATVARTMTTGDLDPAPSIPPEWTEEHFIVTALMESMAGRDVSSANRLLQDLRTDNTITLVEDRSAAIQQGLADFDAVSLTDSVLPGEFYPGAHDYVLDIDDYCIERGTRDQPESERAEMERFHQTRLEEDAAYLERRERVRTEMEAIRQRAMAEGRRLDRVRAEERRRARVNVFDEDLEEWSSTVWPDEERSQQ